MKSKQSMKTQSRFVWLFWIAVLSIVLPVALLILVPVAIIAWDTILLDLMEMICFWKKDNREK